MSNRVRVSIRVSGRVQGVFFRQTTAQEANRIGVKGWVKNLPDGDVQAVIEGEREEVDRLVQWCRYGPPSARVDEVKVTQETYTGEFTNFSVRY